MGDVHEGNAVLTLLPEPAAYQCQLLGKGLAVMEGERLSWLSWLTDL